MSHFAVLVILPVKQVPSREDAYNIVTELLAPFNENDESCDQAKWDWWQIGGRWTGSLGGYDPRKDPANWEDCFICGGTGTRKDRVCGSPIEGVCNGCDQYLKLGLPPGKALSFSYQDYPGDVALVKEVLRQEFTPFALVTPEGEWIERGSMGWFAVVVNEKEPESWISGVKAILEKYQDRVAVLVDCHV